MFSYNCQVRWWSVDRRICSNEIEAFQQAQKLFLVQDDRLIESRTRTRPEFGPPANISVMCRTLAKLIAKYVIRIESFLGEHQKIRRAAREQPSMACRALLGDNPLVSVEKSDLFGDRQSLGTNHQETVPFKNSSSRRVPKRDRLARSGSPARDRKSGCSVIGVLRGNTRPAMRMHMALNSVYAA